ncbi:hypothetical protein AQ490_13375 [Wenjunlia vitaminophila]|uniref:Phosphatase n=1 Tax=Wenjunlia vitaminophila TaxID=76728 RepID=A0A0T6LY24_WENVI|nr:phosphatase [Wenjunlia vitaminophila]KRV50929.1 hypothetical protein AQ490_13375 [Wenjunlia vitaminophila]
MLSRNELRQHLLATGIAGRVATPRQRNLHSYRLFAAGDPRVRLGLDPLRPWTEPALLRLMAARCGVSPDPGHTAGQDTIDPDRTLAALDALAERLAAAAAERVPVLFGTGHPHRLLGWYAALAAALSAAGCPVLTPARGRTVDMATRFGVRPHVLDYVRAVALVRPSGARRGRPMPPAHSHSPLPVRTALCAAAETGGPLPRLVIGDHGWACGAGQLGIEAVGLADTDDPALFVAEAEGRVLVTVPLDDAVRSDYYLPLTRYVLKQACLSQ